MRIILAVAIFLMNTFFPSLTMDIMSQECAICKDTCSLEDSALNQSYPLIQGKCIKQHGLELHKNCLLNWWKHSNQESSCPGGIRNQI